MICYKDKTFCKFYEECALGKDCSRALTPKVIEDASKWCISIGAPISIYSDKPECFKEIEDKDED